MPVGRKYENDAPMTDEYEALKLLKKEWGDRTVRRLLTRRNDEPHIEVAVYNSGYGSEEYTSSEYYRVAPELVAKLRQDGYVQGTPHWGYTDDRELQISDLGVAEWWRQRKSRQAAAAAEIRGLIASWDDTGNGFILILKRALDADPNRRSDLLWHLAEGCASTPSVVERWLKDGAIPPAPEQAKILGLLRQYFDPASV